MNYLVDRILKQSSLSKTTNYNERLDELLTALPKPLYVADVKGGGYPNLYWDDATGEGIWTASYLDEFGDVKQYYTNEDEGLFELRSHGDTPQLAVFGLYKELEVRGLL